MHIAMNMLGLYMLGASLEKHLGGKRFLIFYLTCGMVGGVAYVVIGTIYPQFVGNKPIIGASGAIFGIVLACAVLLPQVKLILLFFLVPIRIAAMIIFGIMILTVLPALSGKISREILSDICHLGGAGAAAVWIWVLPRIRESLALKQVQLGKGAWERKLKRREADEAVVNIILDKIKNQGLTSLTGKEKKILQQATKRQKHEDQ